MNMKTLKREEGETKIDFFFPHLELEDVTNVQQLLNVRFFDSFLSLMKGSCHPTKKRERVRTSKITSSKVKKRTSKV